MTRFLYSIAYPPPPNLLPPILISFRLQKQTIVQPRRFRRRPRPHPLPSA